MADKKRENRRSNVGIGSTYRKGNWQDLSSQQEIGSVMQGQVCFRIFGLFNEAHKRFWPR